jgi:hypothetical protein
LCIFARTYLHINNLIYLFYNIAFC